MQILKTIVHKAFGFLPGSFSSPTLPFERMARLEVSGIRKGDRSQINARVKLKTEQTRTSDAQGLPAYIIVVEFSRPISIIGAKQNPEGTVLQ
ncbi:MAG: hypothetical protein EAZ60_01650 [Oscillatoriales cyanobacterium]|nr:MAG: hypothetical protein EAZ60_01650 [Oscillatoriales cyanobacterium]